MNMNFEIKDTEINTKLSRIAVRPNEIIECSIDYPLSIPLKFKVKGGKTGRTYLQLADIVIKKYHYIYDNEDKFEIWGHGIGDLVLAGIDVNHKTGKATVHVDS